MIFAYRLVGELCILHLETAISAFCTQVFFMVDVKPCETEFCTSFAAGEAFTCGYVACTSSKEERVRVWQVSV